MKIMFPRIFLGSKYKERDDFLIAVSKIIVQNNYSIIKYIEASVVAYISLRYLRLAIIKMKEGYCNKL